MKSLDELLSSQTAGFCDDAITAALAPLRTRAKREAGCKTCRGYGWHARKGLPEEGEVHAAHVLVCTCEAGDRFWALALAETEMVLRLMELDASGRISSSDGMYGRFGINDRRLLLAAARSVAP